MDTLVTVKETAPSAEVSVLDEPDCGLVFVSPTSNIDVEKLSNDVVTSVKTVSPSVCIGKVDSSGDTVGVTEVSSDVTALCVGSI